MGGGGTQYRDTVRKIGKYRNTVSNIDEIPIPHLDPFRIGHAYFKLHPSSVFIYQVPNVMTVTYGQRTFSYCAPKLWNGLPKSLKESETVTIFKKKLKTFLFRDYFNL